VGCAFKFISLTEHLKLSLANGAHAPVRDTEIIFLVVSVGSTLFTTTVFLIIGGQFVLLAQELGVL
jgi:hypothetical protein